MEACTDDSVIPLFPQILPVDQFEDSEKKPSISRKRRRSALEESNGGVLKKGREKRKEMSESFDVLQSLVPNLSPKATRENIVSETIQFIEFLQKQLMRLEMEKKQPSAESVTTMIQSSTISDSSSGGGGGGGVIVSVSGNVVLFGIIASVRRGMVTQILMAFERHQAEVLAANVAVSHGNLSLTVTASVHGYVENTVEMIRNDILSLKK